MPIPGSQYAALSVPAKVVVSVVGVTPLSADSSPSAPAASVEPTSELPELLADAAGAGTAEPLVSSDASAPAEHAAAAAASLPEDALQRRRSTAASMRCDVRDEQSAEQPSIVPTHLSMTQQQLLERSHGVPSQEAGGNADISLRQSRLP